MRIVLINLERASERRARMEEQFAEVGLPFEIQKAVDGRLLSADDLAYVDWEGQRRRGIPPQTDGAIALWLTQRALFQDLVENGPEMMAVFEDDALLDPGLPDVLRALERKPFGFDVVALNRRHPRRRFYPCVSLTARHTAGRIRFSDSGGEGYVITRCAARRFLESTPKMVWPVDHAILRFWVNALDVFYVNPPVVGHAGYEGSMMEGNPVSTRLRAEAGDAIGFWRQTLTTVSRGVQKYVAFRKLLHDDRRNRSLPLIQP